MEGTEAASGGREFRAIIVLIVLTLVYVLFGTAIPTSLNNFCNCYLYPCTLKLPVHIPTKINQQHTNHVKCWGLTVKSLNTWK